MKMQEAIAVVIVAILMAAILFNVGSMVQNSAGEDITEKGGQKNEKAGCVFSNPAEGDKCLEKSSMKTFVNEGREKV